MRQPDLLVLGGNPGGCVAAITAARAGLSVVLLESTRTLGGHNANGVFAFDTGDPATLGPVAREFADLVQQHYESSSDPVLQSRKDPVWESCVAARVWASLCASVPTLSVQFGAVPVDAVRDGRRVVGVTWEPADSPAGDLHADPLATERHEVRARLVIDASYEGDLLAWADIPHRLGREARSAAEPHAGRIYTSDRQFGPGGVRPHSVLPGSTGEADDKVMAFATRLHCRWYDDPAPDAAHRIRQPTPAYDPSRYRWEPREYADDKTPVWFTGIELLVGGKVLLSRTVTGNDVAGPAGDYIRAHPRERRHHRQAIVDHALDFLYYVQNDGGCPTLGLVTDEFADHDNIPYRIYAREGRRVQGVVTLTETDLSPFLSGDGVRPGSQRDSVAVGDWAIESRATTDELEPGHTWPEGWFFDRFSRAPHQIPFGCLLSPDVDNVAFCGPISATHLAFSALRVEATRMNLGEAAGHAAVLVAEQDHNVGFHDVRIAELQHRLIAGGSALTFFADVPASHPHFTDIQWAALRGWVPVDDQWRYRPSHAVTWGELVETVVTVLAIPRSVTGSHFRRIQRHHRAFVATETLYDLSTRTGIDIFDLDAVPATAVSSLLAPSPPGFDIDLDPAEVVPVSCSRAFVERLAAALGFDARRVEDAVNTLQITNSHDEPLQRSDLAHALHTLSCSLSLV